MPKSLQGSLEENFEIRPYNGSAVFIAAFILSPSDADIATEISDGKQNTIHSGGD